MGVFVTAILIFVVISVGIFDTWNFRPYVDSTLSAQLIGELNQLYGPVTDEQAYFALRQRKNWVIRKLHNSLRMIPW